MDRVACDDDRAFLAAGQRRHLAVGTHRLQGGVEIGRVVEAADLLLVGEDDVDVLLDEILQLVLVAVHQEGVGQGEGDLAAGGVGKARGGQERRLGRRRIPEIGRPSCRKRLCQYVEITVVAGYVKKKQTSQPQMRIKKL